MKKLTLTLALLLTVAAAAHAQTSGNPGYDPVRDSLRRGDAARTEEALISASRTASAKSESEADAVRSTLPPTFNARIRVTNSAAKTIKAVVWQATLLDPETGAVIRSYDLKSETHIAPGKTKRLSKRLRTPRAQVVKASSRTPRKSQVADLKVKVKGVTYEDGSTSTTP